MKSLIGRKISVKLLIIITLCFFLAVTACLLFSRYVVYYYMLGRRDNISIAQGNLIVLFVLILGIGVFIFSFLLIINKEIRYIKYIANQVKKIADEGFGKTLEIRGSDELSELCVNINTMSIELKKKIDEERAVEKNKTELITSVSHDLRTPLTAIIGYLNILKNEKFNNKEEEKDYILSTYNLSIKLKKLIDELFEYTKLSSSEVNLETVEVDICSILNQIVGEYTPIFENKGLKVISHIPETELFVRMDVEKMVRVFDNILSNAEKYSYRPSDIIVNLEKDSESVVISFSNKCEYIPPDKLSRMFERFYRVDTSRSSRIEGAGLGLAISKRIVELHNGEIWAESDGDKITFKIKMLFYQTIKA